MSIPKFLLTKYFPITITSSAVQGTYDDDGNWVPPVPYEFVADCNIQPAKWSKILQMPESDRTEDWLVVYSASALVAKKEGVDGYVGDRFTWLDDLYEVRKTKHYRMGILDHTEAMAVRIELTQE